MSLAFSASLCYPALHMKINSFFCKAVTSIGVAALFAPSLALAATPQQLLSASIVSMNAHPATRVTGTINITVSERAWTKVHTPSSGLIGISFDYRVVSSTGSLQEGEGRFTLEKFSYKTVPPPNATLLTLTPTEISLPEPIAIDWKTTNRTMYLLINSLPQQFIDMAAAMDVDVTVFVGKWLSFDLSMLEELVKEKESPSAEMLLDHKKLSALQNPFQLRYVEKRYKNAKGEDMLRLRVRLNPSMIWGLQQAEIKAVNRLALDRWKQISAINKRYAELRRTLSHFQLVAIVNQTTGALDRIEIGGSETKPKKTCTWSTRLVRTVCTNTYSQTVKVSIGLNFLKDSGTPVLAPFTSTPFLEIIERLEAAAQSETSTTTVQ